jgi:hypothetical protein
VRSRLRSAPDWLPIIILITFQALFLIQGTPAQAQAGYNAVYNSSGTPSASPAFIDASQVSQGTDICATLLNILTNQATTFMSGMVIDARGIISATPMVCAASPWNGNVTTPSTILLPAGTIVIPNTWTLPSNTKLIGQGYGTTGGTVIQACTNSKIGCPPTGFPTGNPMIVLGIQNCSPGIICASGISVENLMLNGSTLNINGIQNATAESSYIDHVTLFQIMETGLVVSAPTSGPYTNITFDSGSSALSSTVCVNINGANGTLGVRGLTCIAGTNANVAVYLDSSNSSIEDLRIAGFNTGILVGSQAAAHSDVLLNIFGDTLPPRNIQAPVNVISITNNPTNVSDLSIMGVNNVGGSNTNTIQDALTGPTLPDSYVAMYVLGESANGGYSRYTTSPNAATWASGTSATPTGGCNAQTAGSLYSNTSGGGTALWVCPVGATSWFGVK